MRILTVIDLNDEDLTEAYDLQNQPPSANNWGHEWDDLEQSLGARLGYDGTGEACYAGPADQPVRGQLVAMSPLDFGMPALLDCAEVGLEGLEGQDAYWLVSGIIAQLRQYDTLRHDPSTQGPQ